MAKSASLNRVALIDADGIIFAVACNGEKAVRDGDKVLYLQTLTEEEAYSNVVERMERLTEEVLADTAIICLTHTNNFRYGIEPTYKGNRKDTRRPPLIETIRAMLQSRAPYPVLLIDGLEADDVCGISSGSLQRAGKQAIICSGDKDLRTIPGFLYSCREGSVIEEITPQMANRFHLFQTLCGDPVDHYGGCPKIGAIKAKTILDDCDGLSYAATWERVVAEFEKKGLTREYALTQARLARILRVEDWDAEAKEPILWEPPVQVATPVEELTR